MSNITSEADKAFEAIMSSNAIPQDVSVHVPDSYTDPAKKPDLTSMLASINNTNKAALDAEELARKEEERKAKEEEAKRLEEERLKVLQQKAEEEKRLQASINAEVEKRLSEKAKELEKEYQTKSRKSLLGNIFGKKTDNASVDITAKEPSVTPSNSPDLSRLAFTDSKFDINNANAFNERLNGILECPKGLSFVFIDANNLKYTNDNFGHDAGDTLLKAIADALKTVFGADNVYRQGGDEFCAIINTPENLQIMCMKVKTELDNTAKNIHCLYPMSVSMGYSTADGKLTKHELFEIADAMMYDEKARYHEAHPEYNMRGTNAPFQNLSQETSYDYEDIYEYLSENREDIYSILLVDSDGESLWIFQNLSTAFDMLNNMDIDRKTIGFCFIIAEDEYKYFGDDLDEISKLKPLIKALKKPITEKELLSKYSREIQDFEGVFIG